MTSDAVVLDWYGCDLRTGRIVEDLPALRPTGVLSRRLGAHTSTAFELALGGAPADWEAATAPGRSLLVAVDRDTDTPVWPGIVLTRDGGSTQTVNLGAATPEAYLERRYTGDVTIVQQDQADAAAAAVTPALTQGPPFVLDATATGTLMDWIVMDGDDRTALSALQELMGLDGGPEWTIDVAWKADRSGFDLPLRIASRIGSQAPAPEGTFDFPGCISSYTLAESYEAGKGATVVQARGEGEGTSRLTSVPQVADQLEALGWPRYVHRFTPATGVTDPDQLTRHAAQALALMGTGARVWTVDAVASKAPRIGRDWALGHTVRIDVTTSPRHPKGMDVVARAWSWELDPGADRVRPILVQED
ncbi:hypothetical protein [Streptomyces zhihengii]|uniref:Phage tail protein n=1 Tax=Streptomyces zhihengii TaxID=1818004 RepID=A0ABS2UTY6_9ACTN|nr:hypothetical protein [Streptomyces zhihengii]MBM9621036.1 hypothetical protein [Streptomyces zhihengii]